MRYARTVTSLARSHSSLMLRKDPCFAICVIQKGEDSIARNSHKTRIKRMFENRDPLSKEERLVVINRKNREQKVKFDIGVSEEIDNVFTP